MNYKELFQISVGISVANSVGFLAISAWHLLEVNPDSIHLFTSISAVPYAATAFLLRRIHSNPLHLINGTIAVALLAVSVPLSIHYLAWSYDWMALAWVAKAACIFLVGYRLKEIVYRIEAYLLSAAGFLAIVSFNLQGSPVDRYVIIAATLMPAILFFYYLREKIQHITRTDSEAPESGELGIGFGYLAATVLAGLIWQEIETDFVGAILLAISFAYTRFRDVIKRYL